MFTGIITDIGTLLGLDRQGDLRARIGTRYDVDGIDIGASIACDGVCLTVVDLGRSPQNWFDVQISAETLSCTTLGGWETGQPINLERALRVGDELGGHIVSGHVDGLAQVIGVRPAGVSLRVTFRAPHALAGFIAPKGSVALNGTTLTVRGMTFANGGGAAFTGSGGALGGERAGQQHRSGLGVGLQHRREQSRGDAHSGANQLEQLKHQVVIAFGPVERQPRGGRMPSNRGSKAQCQVVG